ncbi:hypothetical protein [Streptomyces sp. bgisy095]|uniref:hypothetical protein n=1 Tax=unclassified Streptomyces TaxID=2593676 RepID=UPI003D728A35
MRSRRKPGAAEHLALERLDAVDVPFDDARVPGEGEAGDDGTTVAVDARSRAAERCVSGGGGANALVTALVAEWDDFFPWFPGLGVTFVAAAVEVGLVLVED